MSPSRFDSRSEMPGLYCRLTSSVPSSKGGRKVRGNEMRGDGGYHDGRRGDRKNQIAARERPNKQRPIGALEIRG